jgi:glutathione peroxidase
MSLEDIPLTTIDGTQTTLAAYPGTRLIVNVASRCGFTPQYGGLERLQEKYGAAGFTVLGFPSNQFLQELGSEGAIQEFCQLNYGVTFPMFAKVRVNGRSAHPLFTELTKTPDVDGKAGKVAWNFEKFLVMPDGVVHRFRSKTEPEDPAVIALIEASLPA